MSVGDLDFPKNPFVFQCKLCKTIIGDSFGFLFSKQEIGVVLSGSSNVSRSIEVTSQEGFDCGSTYFEFTCSSCDEILGRYYLTTSEDLDDVRLRFTFLIDKIFSYELGNYENGISMKELLEQKKKSNTDRAHSNSHSQEDAADASLHQPPEESSQDTSSPNLSIESQVDKIQNFILQLDRELKVLKEKQLDHQNLLDRMLPFMGPIPATSSISISPPTHPLSTTSLYNAISDPLSSSKSPSYPYASISTTSSPNPPIFPIFNSSLGHPPPPPSLYPYPQFHNQTHVQPPSLHTPTSRPPPHSPQFLYSPKQSKESLGPPRGNASPSSSPSSSSSSSSSTALSSSPPPPDGDRFPSYLSRGRDKGGDRERREIEEEYEQKDEEKEGKRDKRPDEESDLDDMNTRARAFSTERDISAFKHNGTQAGFPNQKVAQRQRSREKNIKSDSGNTNTSPTFLSHPSMPSKTTAPSTPNISNQISSNFSKTVNSKNVSPSHPRTATDTNNSLTKKMKRDEEKKEMQDEHQEEGPECLGEADETEERHENRNRSPASSLSDQKTYTGLRTEAGTGKRPHHNPSPSSSSIHADLSQHEFGRRPTPNTPPLLSHPPMRSLSPSPPSTSNSLSSSLSSFRPAIDHDPRRVPRPTHSTSISISPISNPIPIRSHNLSPDPGDDGRRRMDKGKSTTSDLSIKNNLVALDALQQMNKRR